MMIHAVYGTRPRSLMGLGSSHLNTLLSLSHLIEEARSEHAWPELTHYLTSLPGFNIQCLNRSLPWTPSMLDAVTYESHDYLIMPLKSFCVDSFCAQEERLSLDEQCHRTDHTPGPLSTSTRRL